MVKAAAGNTESGLEVIALLQDRRADQITITERVIKTAAGNTGYGTYGIMGRLLKLAGNRITITDEMIKIAAENHGYNGRLMVGMLERRRDDDRINQDYQDAVEDIRLRKSLPKPARKPWLAWFK